MAAVIGDNHNLAVLAHVQIAVAGVVGIHA